MITRQLLAHCAPGSSLLSSLFLDLVPRQLLHSVLRFSPVSIAMASVAYRQITATCNARNPVPPEGASGSDRSRLFELCGLKRTVQPNKNSLQARSRSAKLKGMYYTQDEKGNKCQMNSEFLVAQLLLAEGRASAVPVGWLQAAPIRTAYLDIKPAVPAQAAAPQPVVYDMPSRSRQRESYLLCVSCIRFSLLGN